MYESNERITCGIPFKLLLHVCPLNVAEPDHTKSASISVLRQTCEGRDVPVGHDDGGDETPDVEDHAHPAGHYTHPHSDFGAADEDIVVGISRSVYRRGCDDFPEEGIIKTQYTDYRW